MAESSPHGDDGIVPERPSQPDLVPHGGVALRAEGFRPENDPGFHGGKSVGEGEGQGIEQWNHHGGHQEQEEQGVEDVEQTASPAVSGPQTLWSAPAAKPS
ncbi:hypothetical protein D3C75_782200 [compost metagenome]